MSSIKSVSVCTFSFLRLLPHVPALAAVRLCLSACSSWISSDSSVAAASFSLTASVSIRSAPPCWTGGATHVKEYVEVTRSEILQKVSRLRGTASLKLTFKWNFANKMTNANKAEGGN